jgi:translation elongation factor EF-Tu-like GTPase
MLLAKVESVFTITGRGTVVIPAFLSQHQLHQGEHIQLRSSAGKIRNSAILSVTSVNLGAGKRRPAFMLTRDIAKQDVAEGDEIWIQDTQEVTESDR